MTRAHFVKKSRTEQTTDSGEKLPIGSSYWWWKFNFSSHKHVSKTQPGAAQLTQSGFEQELISIQEDIGNIDSTDLESGVQSVVEHIEQLRDECQEKLDNMPESLQESSSSGQLLQERIDALESWKDDLEAVDLDVDEADVEDTVRDEMQEEWEVPEALEDATEEAQELAFKAWLDEHNDDFRERVEGALDDKRQEILEEIQNTDVSL